MSRARRLASALAALRPDTTPLRISRDYRLLYASSAVSLLGSMVTAVAAPYQVKVLTDSPIAVGAIGIVELVPTVVFGLLGGAIADVHDRRRVLLLTEVAALLCSALLAGNALLPSPSLLLVYLAAAGAASAAALHRPSAEAMLARLIPAEHQAAAASLLGLQGTVGQIAGPALGGVLAVLDLPLAYGVDVATFVLSVLLLSRVRPMRAASEGTRVRLADIAVGIRYAAGRRDLLGTYLIDIAAMAFAMPQALFPFLADGLGAPQGLGLLYSAGAIGSAAVTLTGGWMPRVRRHGRMIVLAAAGWGVAVAAAGLAPGYWAVVGCFVVAGAFDMVSGVFRGAIWNSTIPDALRGRLAGIELLSYTTGPTLGNARAGLMAGVLGIRPAIALGGALCVGAVGVTALALPALWRGRRDPGGANAPVTEGAI
ncbi:MAG TPA: MFS transporter [Amnibacterium sp.]|nr:MFS transporter [Amnibacterium sp.]